MPETRSATSSLLPTAETSSVTANIRAGEKSILQTVQERRRKPTTLPAAAALLAIRPTVSLRNNPYFDRALHTSVRLHKPRQIKFIEHGKFAAEAEKIRVREEMEALRRDVSESLSKIGIDTEIVSDLLTIDTMPEVEWWDMPFLDGPCYDSPIKSDGISNLIQRPALLPPPVDINAVVKPRPLFLTPKEQQKLRRQRRLADHREKQEKIKLGLLPPDPAKTRIANIARILGTQSVQEPSKIEAEIRAQALQRHEKHLQTNQQRSEQSKETAADKKRQKQQEAVDIFNGTVAIFRINNLAAPQWRFKVTKNAQQYNLTGCVVYYEGMNLVIVEGSAPDIRRYTHLLLDRIKWKESPADANIANVNANACYLVWEGIIKERIFSGFVSRSMDAEVDAREYLSKFGLEHYWKLAKEFKPM